MAVTATKVSCPAGVYTAIATAATNVSMRVKTMAGTTLGRIAFAGSQPAASSTDFVAISNREWNEFGSLDENAYFMPVGSNAIVEVIAG